MFVSYYVKDQETYVINYEDRENGESLMVLTLPVDPSQWHEHTVTLCDDPSNSLDAVKLVGFHALNANHGRLTEKQVMDMVAEVTREANMLILERTFIENHPIYGTSVFHSDYHIYVMRDDCSMDEEH